MSFQWIIDNCEQLSINRRGVVASTQTRDGRVRSVSRGAQPYTFTVTLPAGPLWTDYKDFIAAAEALDRHTPAVINFNAPDLAYLGLAGVNYIVKCIQFPQWTIFQRNQIRWDGPFVFQEIL